MSDAKAVVNELREFFDKLIKKKPEPVEVSVSAMTKREKALSKTYGALIKRLHKRATAYEKKVNAQIGKALRKFYSEVVKRHGFKSIEDADRRGFSFQTNSDTHEISLLCDPDKAPKKTAAAKPSVN